MRANIFTLKTLCFILLIKASLIELYDVWQFERSKRWHNRKWLVRPINKKRLTLGHFNTIFQELKTDPALFFSYTRMDIQTFNYLLSLIKPHVRILKKRKNPIYTEERLALILRYLATGDDISSIALDYRMGFSTASAIIKKTCRIIHKVLSKVYLRQLSRPVWRNIAKGFYSDWNMPNYIGAIDGKHIEITAPPNSGSLYFNYKKFNSIILLAACNHRYEFTLVDVGAYGGESDGDIFARSELGKSLEEKSLDIPEEYTNLPGSNIKMPYYFVGDEAFKLTENLMRPYPGRHLSDTKRIFNYRLSRARRCIESAFGILVARWRVLSKPIGFEPESVDLLVLATVCLHNFLMARTQKQVRQMYCPQEPIHQEDMDEMSVPENIAQNHAEPRTTVAHDMRDKIAQYFLSPEGEVSWQYDYISRGKYQDTREVA